jgi:hypothetical protein
VSAPLETASQGEKQPATAKKRKKSKARVKPAVPAPPMDILGVWKEVKSGSEGDSMSITYRKDSFKVFQGRQSSTTQYTIVRAKAPLKDEMEISWKNPDGTEIRVSLRRSGDRLWTRFPDGTEMQLKYVYSVEESDRKVAEVQLQGLRRDLGTFRSILSRYPKKLEELRSSGMTTRPNALVDPWKKPFHYSVSGKEITLCSDGPDGKRATKDDICLK